MQISFALKKIIQSYAMRIYVLTDNFSENEFDAEHGLSYFIEIDGQKFLFDTGHSDVFIKNALKLGIDITQEVKTVVLSHGHWDHGNGLKYLKGLSLITHPDAFSIRYRKKDHSPVGLSLSRQGIKKQFRLRESRGTCHIGPHLMFLGQIPRSNDFERQHTTYEFADGSDDFIPDDSALVASLPDGLVIVTACSHSGICNICDYAKAVTGMHKIKAVLGGFHLKKVDDQTVHTVDYLKKNEIERILTSHCTSLPVSALFGKHFSSERLKAGMIREF